MNPYIVFYLIPMFTLCYVLVLKGYKVCRNIDSPNANPTFPYRKSYIGICNSRTYFTMLLIGSSCNLFALDSSPDSLIKTNKPAVTDSSKKNLTNKENIPQTARFLVYDIYNLDHPDKNDTKHFRAGLGDKIRINVHGMTRLLAKSQQQHKEIKLFLDHRQLDDIKPTSGAPDVDDNYFEFTLKRTSVNDKVWNELLGKPSSKSFYYRPTEISVGLDGTYAEDSTVNNFQLIRIRENWFWGGLLFLLVYSGMLFYLVFTTNILRETGTDVTPLGVVQPNRPPFSLGKLQMAYWFSLVLASFLFIWMVTGNYDIITSGVLGLIGISATTALGAVAIDDNKGQVTINEILELRKQKADLDALILTQPGKLATPAQSAQDTQINADILRKKSSLTLASNGLIDDILTDVNGISFHRLQIFIWTIVLGVIFIYSVWASLTMPDFSATLLTLQGITAGTYLGFKFPEKQA